MCVHACTHLCMLLCMHARICVRAHVCMCACIHTQLYVTCACVVQGDSGWLMELGKNSEKVNVLYISAVNLTTLTFQNFYLEEAITDDDGIGDIVCRVLRYTRLFAVCLTLSLSLSLRLSACACVCVSLSLCLHASACLYLWDVSIVRPLLLAHMPCGVCPSPCR